MAPGATGLEAARVSGCHGHHGFERLVSMARCEALSQQQDELALGQIFRHFALSLAHAQDRNVGTDVLEDDDPVGVVLIDRGIKRQRDWAGHQHVVRQQFGHVAQALDGAGLRRRHLHEGVRRLRFGRARRRDRVGRPVP